MASTSMKEYYIDLHVHTPIFKDDYFENNITYLDILEEARDHELSIIAITDHNTIAGYRQMIHSFRDLKRLGTTLKEADIDYSSNPKLLELDSNFKRYNKLLNSSDFLALPGMEISVGGIHIIGIFDKGKNIEETLSIVDKIYALLIEIGLKPEDQSLQGYTSLNVQDVCKKIIDNGGLTIAAHTAKSDGLHGKLGKGRPLQDATQHIMAVEVSNYKEWKDISDLHSGDRDGYKYIPCIMSSDSHCLHLDPKNPTHEGRVVFSDKRRTKIALEKLSFTELRKTFETETPSSGRIGIGGDDLNYIRSTLESSNVNVHFWKNFDIFNNEDDCLNCARQIAAFANSIEGKLIFGVEIEGDLHAPKFHNIEVDYAKETLGKYLPNLIMPTPDFISSVLTIDKKKIFEITVPKGRQCPYVLRKDGSIWVFDNGEIYPASPPDIIDLVRPIVEEELLNKLEKERNEIAQERKSIEARMVIMELEKNKIYDRLQESEEINKELETLLNERERELSDSIMRIPPPNSGIEIIESTKNYDKYIHKLRDLRNDKKYPGRTWENTTGIHHYAIGEHENLISTNYSIPDNAIESRIHPDIWVILNRFREDNWRLNIFDFRGRAKKIYYSVLYDSLEGEWKKIADACIAQRKQET